MIKEVQPTNYVNEYSRLMINSYCHQSPVSSETVESGDLTEFNIIQNLNKEPEVINFQTQQRILQIKKLSTVINCISKPKDFTTL